MSSQVETIREFTSLTFLISGASRKYTHQLMTDCWHEDEDARRYFYEDPHVIENNDCTGKEEMEEK